MSLLALGGILGGAGKLFGAVTGNKKKTTENANYFTSENTNSTGTRTPILSQDWQNAFAAARGNLGQGGFTAGQQGAYDWARNSMGPGGAVGQGVANTNALLGGYTDSLNNLQAGYNYMAQRPAYQLGAAPQEQYVGDVTARTGASFMDQYRNPYERQVVDATVSDYNADVDRTLAGLRQGRDAAGAFGDRGQIAEGQFLGDANRGLLSTVANLRARGFDTAAGFGQQDASRALLADAGNQTTRQGVNARNTGLLDSRERANIDLQQNRDRDIFQSAEGIANTLAAKAGLNQQQLANIVTANGIDATAAKAMFDMGSISQQQLLAILEAAQAGTGESLTENRTGTGTRTGSGTGTSSGGFDPGLFSEGWADIFRKREE